jgi:hypothetical protein
MPKMFFPSTNGSIENTPFFLKKVTLSSISVTSRPSGKANACFFSPFFTTSLLVTHFDDGYAKQAAMIYSASLLLTSILYNIVWWYASTHRYLLVSGLTSQVIQQMTRRYFVSIPLYIITLLVSAFNVQASLVLYIAIALVYALPANLFPFGKKRPSHPPETTKGKDEGNEKGESNENDD